MFNVVIKIAGVSLKLKNWSFKVDKDQLHNFFLKKNPQSKGKKMDSLLLLLILILTMNSITKLQKEGYLLHQISRVDKL